MTIQTYMCTPVLIVVIVYTYRIQPRCIRFTPSKCHSPLSSISTNRILPFGLNFVFETVKVSSHSQLTRMMYIVVNAANKVCTSITCSEKTQDNLGKYKSQMHRSKQNMIPDKFYETFCLNHKQKAEQDKISGIHNFLLGISRTICLCYVNLKVQPYILNS